MMKNIIIYIYSYVYSHISGCFLNRRNERGATLVEYGILVGLLSVAAIVIIAFIGIQITDVFNTVTEKLDTIITKLPG
jgi:pilus assembly protein Flp/PilA